MATKCAAPNCPRPPLAGNLFCERHLAQVTRAGSGVMTVVGVVVAVVGVALKALLRRKV